MQDACKSKKKQREETGKNQEFRKHFGKEKGLKVQISQKTGEDRGLFGKNQAQKVILKGGHTLKEALKAKRDQKAILEKLGSKMQIFQKTRFWGVWEY